MALELETWVGQTLCGRYRVLGKLGEGGMGAVFRARDEKLQADVVVKVPRRDLLHDPAFVRRFQSEIRSLVALSHPHVVKVTDADIHDGLPFAVMQYLAGGSLDQRRRCGPGGDRLPGDPQDLPSWLPQIAAALDFLHRKHYVHRDVKPANILFDEHDNAFLGDFGVAKALADQQNQGRGATLTGTGLVLGTPEYMAPEAIMGRAIDGRSDQYALAVVAFEMLCGRRPFEAEVPSAVLVMHTSQRPTLPKELAAALPNQTADCLYRGLAKKPEQRFGSCEEFSQALLATLVGVRAASTTSAPRVARGTPGAVSCPVCSHRLNVKEKHAGRAVECPGCHTVLNVSAARDCLTENAAHTAKLAKQRAGEQTTAGKADLSTAPSTAASVQLPALGDSLLDTDSLHAALTPAMSPGLLAADRKLAKPARRPTPSPLAWAAIGASVATGLLIVGWLALGRGDSTVTTSMNVGPAPVPSQSPAAPEPLTLQNSAVTRPDGQPPAASIAEVTPNEAEQPKAVAPPESSTSSGAADSLSQPDAAAKGVATSRPEPRSTERLEVEPSPSASSSSTSTPLPVKPAPVLPADSSKKPAKVFQVAVPSRYRDVQMVEVARFSIPTQWPAGLASDGANLFVSTIADERRIYALSSSGAVLDYIPAPDDKGAFNGRSNPQGLAYGDGNLILGDSSGLISIVDIGVKRVVGSFWVPKEAGANKSQQPRVSGVAFDGELIYASGLDWEQIWAFERSGKFVRGFKIPFRASGLAFNGINLVAVDSFKNAVHEITREGEEVANFSIPMSGEGVEAVNDLVFVLTAPNDSSRRNGGGEKGQIVVLAPEGTVYENLEIASASGKRIGRSKRAFAARDGDAATSSDNETSTRNKSRQKARKSAASRSKESSKAKAGDNTLTAEEEAQGWQLLFNGHDHTGWGCNNGQPIAAPVEDGCLVPYKSGGYLIVFDQRPFKDFTLKCEVKMARPKCNSGIFFRVSNLADPVNSGLEVALDTAVGTGYHDFGAIYDLARPRRVDLHGPGKFDEVELTCRGPEITVKVNGEDLTKLNCDEFSERGRRPDGTEHKFGVAIGKLPREGYIGFQDHGDKVWFKNVKILEH